MSSRRTSRSGPVLPAVLGAAVASVVVRPEAVGLDRVGPGPALTAFRPVVSAAVLAAGALLAARGGIARGGVTRGGVTRGGGARVSGLTAAAVAAGSLVADARTTRDLARGGPGMPPLAEDQRDATLRVLTFNVQLGRADPAALALTIRTARPDVVVLPEAGDRFRRRLAAEIGGLGYRSWSQAPAVVSPSADPDGPCVTVLCARGLGDVTVRPVALEARAGWLEVSGGALGALRIVGVHPTAPVPRLASCWAREVALIEQWFRAGMLTIVTGDLNATPRHAVLRTAARDAVSATVACGQGGVGTWPARWPRWLGVAIDHVLVAPAIRPLAVRVLDLPGSDHRALLTDVLLPSEPAGDGGTRLVGLTRLPVT